MGNMFGSPPTPPNPQTSLQNASQVGQEQQGLNIASAQAGQRGSMIGNTNVLGDLSYTADPNSPGGYRANVSLSPGQQGLYDTRTGTQQAAGTQGQNLITGANYGSVAPSTAIGDMNTGLTNQLIQQQYASIAPIQQTQRDQLDTRLRNTGLFPGAPGYDNAMRELDKSQGLVMSDYLAKTTPQTMAMATNLYQMPWLMGSQMSNFGAPTMPNSAFVQTPQMNVTPSNLVGAYQAATNADEARYNAQAQQYAAQQAGMWGIPSAVLGGWARGGFPGLGTAAGAIGLV